LVNCASETRSPVGLTNRIFSIASRVSRKIRYHVLSKTAKVDSREARAAEDLVEILYRYIQ